MLDLQEVCWLTADHGVGFIWSLAGSAESTCLQYVCYLHFRPSRKGQAASGKHCIVGLMYR